MKIDLKNKIIYLILIGIIFLIPKNVFAAKTTMKYSRIIGNDCGYNFKSSIISGSGYIGGESPKIDGMCGSGFYFTSNENLSGNYTLSGQIYFGLGNNFSSSNLSGSKPTLSINGSMCVIQGLVTDGSYNQSGDNGNSITGFYPFSCESVTLFGSGKDYIYFTKQYGVYSIYVYDGLSYIPFASNADIIDNQNKNQEETNKKMDEIKDMDISEENKQMPDDSSYQDYTGSQDELLDKTKDADLNVLDVGLDTKSSSWVWDTLTSLIQSHSAVFGMFIAILSLGIIKLVLGR